MQTRQTKDIKFREFREFDYSLEECVASTKIIGTLRNALEAGVILKIPHEINLNVMWEVRPHNRNFIL